MGDSDNPSTPSENLIVSQNILPLSKWQYVVAKHVRELSADTGTTTYDELKQRILQMMTETDSLSDSPLRGLSNTLKELRDLGFIRLCGDQYVLLDHRSSLLASERCVSRGEREIARCLRTMGIAFEREKSLKGMVFSNPLRLDFYFMYGTERCAIEYDGKHHTVSHPRTGGDEGLRLTRLRDQRKDEYCQKNNIHLLRIPYTRFAHIRQDIRNFCRRIRASTN